MKHLMIFSCAALVAIMAAAQPALAQPAQPLSPQNHDGHHDKQDAQKDRRHERHERKDRRESQNRQDRREMRHDNRRHNWVRGERFRDHYQGRVYVVRDYRHDHLRRPPRGYHWVRDDNGDFLLVAITTGIILDLLMHSR